MKSGRKIFDIEEALTFQVAVLTNLISRPFYAQMGRYTGMTLNDWRMLLVIACQPGVSQAQIVNATGLKKATVSRSLRVLTNYVRLETDPLDSRKKAARLTDEGWRLYDESLPILDWRLDLLTQALEPAELMQFKQTLAKLVKSARGWEDLPDDQKASSA